MGEEFLIFKVTEAKEEYAREIEKLLPQLSSSHHTFTLDQLHGLIANDCTHLFLLQTEGVIAGMLTLCGALSPTGLKMWIEDVVVDASQRGHSFGRALVEHAIEYVRGNFPEATIMLTSRPARVAANALYRSAGFAPKETNVYSMKLSEQK